MKRFYLPIPYICLTLVSTPTWPARLVSDGTDHTPEPTHCAFYFDGDVLSERTVTTQDADGFPRCDLNLDFVQPGTHVVRAAFQIDNGIWGIEEGPLSDPFEFTRPVGGEGLPAPVLHIEADGAIATID